MRNHSEHVVNSPIEDEYVLLQILIGNPGSLLVQTKTVRRQSPSSEIVQHLLAMLHVLFTTNGSNRICVHLKLGFRRT